MAWSPGADLLGLVVIVALAVYVYIKIRKVSFTEMIQDLKALLQELNKT